MAAQFEIRKKITDQIIAALSSGKLPPWRKTWKGSDNAGTPTNIVSRKAYRGINPLILCLHQEKYGFQSKWYATFDQWKRMGCVVKRRPNDVPPGEWGCGIIFYNIVTKTVEDKYTGVEIEESFPILRSFTVFNVEQIDDSNGNLDKFRADKEITVENSFIDYAPAEELITKSDAEIRYGGDRAFYRPSEDFIQLPNKESFESENEFYATAFHELAHWSEPRLNWKENYSFSELRAEIGAAFLLNELGVPQSEDMTNHHAYLNHWLEHLQKDNRFIFRASAAASKAVDYLLEKTGLLCQEEKTSTSELVTC